MSSAAPKKSRKICVLGFPCVGKSSLTLQFVEARFADDYNPTIENTFQRDVVHGGSTYTLSVLDTAGQDEHSLFNHSYTLGVDGYVLVYSVQSRQSFETISILNDKVLDMCASDKVPRIIVGNKIDLSNRLVSKEEGLALGSKLGCPALECSAKNHASVEEVFHLMIAEIERAQNPPEPRKDNKCTLL